MKTLPNPDHLIPGIKGFTVSIHRQNSKRLEHVPIFALNNSHAISTVLELYPHSQIVSVSLDHER